MIFGKNKQLDRIEKKLDDITGRLTVINNHLRNIYGDLTLISRAESQALDSLSRIERNLKIGVPTHFIVAVNLKESSMTMKASVNFQLLDNGTALLKATPTDAAGLPAALPDGTAPASWSSSDPGLVITVNANDPTGLSATAAPASPPVPVTGAVPTVTATLPDGTSITGTGSAIDVVGGPATGFQVQESAS